MQFYERGAIARTVGFPSAIEYELGFIGYHDRTKPTRADVLRACDDDLGPTHMLLRRAADGVPGQLWTSPVPIPESTIEGGFPDVLNPDVLTDGFVLYDCTAITRGTDTSR